MIVVQSCTWNALHHRTYASPAHSIRAVLLGPIAEDEAEESEPGRDALRHRKRTSLTDATAVLFASLEAQAKRREPIRNVCRDRPCPSLAARRRRCS